MESECCLPNASNERSTQDGWRAHYAALPSLSQQRYWGQTISVARGSSAFNAVWNSTTDKRFAERSGMFRSCFFKAWGYFFSHVFFSLPLDLKALKPQLAFVMQTIFLHIEQQLSKLHLTNFLHQQVSWFKNFFRNFHWFKSYFWNGEKKVATYKAFWTLNHYDWLSAYKRRIGLELFSSNGRKPPSTAFDEKSIVSPLVWWQCFTMMAWTFVLHHPPSALLFFAQTNSFHW